MSLTSRKVQSPRKTSYTAYTSPNQKDDLPFPTTQPSPSKFVHSKLRTHFLILLRYRFWTNIKLTPYTSLQFATSYAADPPKEGLLSIHRQQPLYQCIYYIIAAAARGWLNPSPLNRALYRRVTVIFIPGSILTNSERDREGQRET